MRMWVFDEITIAGAVFGTVLIIAVFLVSRRR